MSEPLTFLDCDWEPPADFDPASTPYAAECAAAAKWWADTFRNYAKADAGDEAEIINRMIGWQRDRERAPITPEQIDTFEQLLARALAFALVNLVSRGLLVWNPTEPERGLVQRSIYIDYHAPPILMFNAKRAGITGTGMTLFPCKTCVWISPGRVRVRCGYRADEVTVYEAKP